MIDVDLPSDTEARRWQTPGAAIRSGAAAALSPAPKAAVDKRAARPFIIPLFIPHCGCPHQCAFCNQQVITGTGPHPPTADTLSRRITCFLTYRRADRTVVQIAFYGGNFLGMAPDRVQAMLEVAEGFVRSGQVDGIRFSTRPDTITASRLSWLKGYSVNTIELGAQSMDDRVLERIKRGHRAGHTVKAVALLRKHTFTIGLQLMVGLPDENRCSVNHTGNAVVRLKPDFVRIYPTLVLKNSLLARWYRSGAYSPLTLDQAVNRTKQLYLLFKKYNIPVIRMGLQASAELNSGQDLLTGPYHPAFGHLVHSAIFLDRLIAALSELPGDLRQVVISVNPAGMSRLRGQQNANLVALKQQFHLQALHIRADTDLKPDAFRIESDL